MTKAGKLILIPNFISEDQTHQIFSEEVKKAVSSISMCCVESEKNARALLRGFDFEHFPSFRELPLRLINEHEQNTQEVIDLLKSGKNVGLISDAGLPLVADPGHDLVFKAKMQGVSIETCGVHSSIIAALMVSGLSSQSFYFVGYMPKAPHEFKEKVRRLEQLSLKERTTILFIETPYRNEVMLRSALEALNPDSYLAYCQGLSSTSEYVYLNKVKNFDINFSKITKTPAVFVFRAY